MDIQILVQEFYAIEAVDALIHSAGSSLEPMRHSHERWLSDLYSFRDQYISQMAAAIYDYTVLVVAAEMRHCNARASQYIEGYYDAYSSRNRVYRDCTVYRAQDILLAGVRMFDEFFVDWRGGYGGAKWKDIAKAGLMKGSVSDRIFIDHCVDLSHNNSVYFDKGAGIFMLTDPCKYRQFLELKHVCIPYALIHEKHGAQFDKLLWRANNLHIIDKEAIDAADYGYRDLAEFLLFEYHPIEWGNMTLSVVEGNIQDRYLYGSGRRYHDDDAYDEAA